ncbi:Gldg family protein [Opitutales bacterium]|nr:Gldg family protein [Opitutales bacterium]
MNIQAVLAVFKRNLAAYFGSPSGYVFICAFLLSSGLAAFWPQEFFDSNLANLDQLNRYLPLILLGFIPAITMSIWADEKRQGTDELLLTLPGSDFDVVIGKYLGAVAIFSVSLVISLIANYYVLSQLGNPDFGLLVSTYLGYWFVGLSMIAIGMVASFLTANLTVAFVLGVAFNSPLALLQDSEWAIAANFLDFSRGIISTSGMIFFIGLAVAMLYLSSILIGRRHWVGSPQGKNKFSHFSVRVVATLITAFAMTQYFRNHDIVRLDATAEQLSSLSEGSIELLGQLNSQVEIDAFISPTDSIPEQYVQTRINLLTALREIDRETKLVSVKIHVITPEDNASATAEKYGVENQNGVTPPLFVMEGGRMVPWQKDLYMGIVCKGDKGQQTIPFLFKGLPVEYEIVRTINSVSGSHQKKTLGVFATDAPVLGTAGMGIMGFNLGGGTPAWEFFTELNKQYDVQEVTGGELSPEDYDALVVVQPSTLDNEKMDDLVAAIKSGIPTAIFEDPLPLIQGSVTGTYEPRRNNNSGPDQGGSAPEKGDLNKLWDLLQVNFNLDPMERLEKVQTELSSLKQNATRTLAPARGRFPEVGTFFTNLDNLINKASEYEARLKSNSSLSQNDWNSLKLSSLRTVFEKMDSNHPIRNFVEQRLLSDLDTKLGGLQERILRDPYNPFPKIQRSENFPDEFVYVGGLPNSFHSDPITSELQYCLFTCPGTLYPKSTSSLDFQPLLRTRGGVLAGTTSLETFWTGGVFGTPRRFNPDRTKYSGSGAQEIIAASISGNVEDGNQTNQINVILVADVDMLADPFFNIRSRGPESDFPLDVDNVTLALNLIDDLSGETSLLEIRNRRRLHRTLEEFEKSIEEAREVASRNIQEAESSIQAILQDENRKLNEALADVQNNQGSMTQGQFMQVLQTEAAKLQKNMAKRERELRQTTNVKIKDAERKRDREIREKQRSIQRLSVFIPPLPLLLIAIFVFYKKRRAEIQGTVDSRVRS